MINSGNIPNSVKHDIRAYELQGEGLEPFTYEVFRGSQDTGYWKTIYIFPFLNSDGSWDFDLKPWIQLTEEEWAGVLKKNRDVN